jgi:hypothetical protein
MRIPASKLHYMRGRGRRDERKRDEGGERREEGLAAHSIRRVQATSGVAPEVT